MFASAASLELLRLLAQALAKANMEAAWKRVKANRGSAGADGRTVQQTGSDLVTEWADIRQALQ